VTTLRAVCVGVVGLLAMTAAPAPAQPDEPARAFVASIVDAINAKSPERRRALLHPRSLPCAGLEPDSFFRMIVDNQSKDTVPADYRWKLAPVPPDETLIFAGQLDYPIRPSHTVQLEFQPRPYHGKVMLLYVVRDANRWFEVLACAKPEMVAAARAARQAKAQREVRVRALAAAMSPELRARVLELAQAGRRVDAAKHYQEATNEDLTTAVEVVELLSPR
jgi:hypothetical protein